MMGFALPFKKSFYHYHHYYVSVSSVVHQVLLMNPFYTGACQGVVIATVQKRKLQLHKKDVDGCDWS